MYASASATAPIPGVRVWIMLRLITAAAPLLLLGHGAALSQAAKAPAQAAQAPAQAAPSVPMPVTTDTQEYCETLAGRVERAERFRAPRAAAAEELAEVDELAKEGHHMCLGGLIRGGLARLRRALIMLHADR